MNVAAASSLNPSSAILLVEDEPVLRTSIARGLAKLPNVEVLTAATYNEAIALLESPPPSLIISDIDLGGESGLELIRELDRRKRDTPLIFVTGHLGAFRDKIPDRPNLEVLEKPVPMADLRSKVSALLGACEPVTPAPFSIADYVQLACIGRHSVRIDKETANGCAYVLIHQGEVWTAVDGAGNGPEAFARIAFGSNGAITCSSFIGEPGERTIAARWEILAMEAARAFDESARDQVDLSANATLPRLRPQNLPPNPPAPPVENRGVPRPQTPARTRAMVTMAPQAQRPPMARKGPPPLPVVPQTQRTVAASPSIPPARVHPVSHPASPLVTFEEQWFKGVEALLDRDFAKAFRSFSAADRLRPNEPGVLANLQRLHEMGYAPEAVGQA